MNVIPVFSTAAQILSELKITTPAVNVNYIARYYGYKIEVSESPNGYFGAISFPERLILVTSEVDPYQQRMIIAAELGHAVLHRHLQDQFADKFKDNNQSTQEVIQFAIELLVPKNWLIARPSSYNSQLMSELFEVPVGVIRTLQK